MFYLLGDLFRTKFKMVQQNTGISEDEAALYDRQIRLWGLDAQKRLRASKVLLVGLKGFGAEISKNIVLAGVKSLVLLDNSQIVKDDGASQFFYTGEDIGKNRAQCSLPGIQQLNPMVEVSADTDNVDDKPDEFFLQFDVVCLTGCAVTTLKRVNTLCRDNKVKFFAGEVNGFFSYTFADLGVHEFVVDVPKTVPTCGEPSNKKDKPDNSDITVVKKTIEFVSYEKVLNVDWKSSNSINLMKKMTDSYFIMNILQRFRTKYDRCPSLCFREADSDILLDIKKELIEETGISEDKICETFSKFCFAELGPVCAITGGILAQEIIKAVSHKDMPHNNFFFYNGLKGSGTVEKIF